MTPKQLRDAANRPWEDDLKPGDEVATLDGVPLGTVTKVEPVSCDASLGTIRRHAGKPVAHPCPFEEDVHDDRDFRCHCCAACEKNCADDI